MLTVNATITAKNYAFKVICANSSVLFQMQKLCVMLSAL